MSLQVWLPLNGDLHNQGLSNITPSLMGSGITYSSGKIGQAATFPNNCNSCIYLPRMRLQTGTYAAWIKVIGAGATSRQCIISEGRDSYKDGVEFYTSQAGTSLSFKAHEKIISTTIALNQWYHVAGTFGNGEVKLYLNGELKGTQTYTADMTYQYALDLVLGKMSFSYTNTSNYFSFNGQLNDVRIYDHALSAKEVEDIAKGLVLHYKLDNNGIGNPNLLPCGGTYIQGSPWTTTFNKVDGYAWVTNSAFKATPGKTYTISVKCDGTLANTHGQSANPSVKSWSFWLYISNSNTTKSWQTGAYDTPINLTSANHNYRKIGNTHVWTYTLSSTQEYISLRTNSYSNGTDNVTIHWWDMKVEEGDSFTGWSPNFSNTSITYDSSGYNNNGTVVGSLEATTPSPKYSCATSFDNQEYIIHKLPENMYQATYSFWVKASSYTGYGAVYMPYQSPSAGTSPWFAINTESCKVWAYFGNNSPHYTKGSGTMPLNKWHHCVYVWDNGVAQWYVDGEKNGNSVTYTGRTFIQNTANATIGNSFTGTNWNGTPFNGQISDFRIYATALTEAQIKELYMTSMSIDGTNIVPRDLE